MDAGKPQVEPEIASQIIGTTATVCGICFLGMSVVMGFFVFPLSLLAQGPSPAPLKMFLYALAGTAQLFALGLMVAAVFAVAGSFPKPWSLSADAWMLLGLMIVVIGIGVLSCRPPRAIPSGKGIGGVLVEGALALWQRVSPLSPVAVNASSSAAVSGAVALWVWVRVHEQWRWPGAGVGHVLSAAAIFLYGGLVSTLIITQSWLAGLAFASVFGYGVCYALGLVTLRADEFQATCRPDAGPRSRPSVRLTALILSLTAACSASFVWLLVKG